MADLRDEIADVLARFPCRASNDPELDRLRRFEVTAFILAIPQIAEALELLRQAKEARAFSERERTSYVPSISTHSEDTV
jgi:hypothetical protein